jgi:hypothetical protein
MSVRYDINYFWYMCGAKPGSRANLCAGMQYVHATYHAPDSALQRTWLVLITLYEPYWHVTSTRLLIGCEGFVL